MRDIETKMVDVNGQQFEIAMCGNGEKLALFLHGFPELNHSWRHQMRMLADMGYTCWAPNLRGYGNSYRPKGVKNYIMDRLLEDVGGFVDAAQAGGGHKDVTLIAHDWGGAIAWMFVMRKVRPLTRFIVMNLPHPKIMMDKIREGGPQRRRSWYVFFFQIPWLPEFFMKLGKAKAVRGAFYNMAVDKSRFPDEVLDIYAEAALKPGALTAMINYYRGIMRGGKSPEAENGFPRIDTPTLMIWGEEDSALDKTTTFGTDQLVDDFTIRYLPQVSHWVQQEAPEKVNAMMAAWLRGEHVPEAHEIEVTEKLPVD